MFFLKSEKKHKIRILEHWGILWPPPAYSLFTSIAVPHIHYHCRLLCNWPYFQRLIQVRPSAPQVFQRRTFKDCRCGFLPAGFPFLSSNQHHQSTERMCAIRVNNNNWCASGGVICIPLQRMSDVLRRSWCRTTHYVEGRGQGFHESAPCLVACQVH